MTTNLTIPISSSPFGALLTAAGLATWLSRVGRDITGDNIDVRIAHAGHSICVSTVAALAPQKVRAEDYAHPPFPWIRTAKNGPAPVGVDVLDYEGNRQRNADYFTRLKALQKAGGSIRGLSEDERRALEEQAPIADWPAAALINQMGALNTYNKAIERWHSCRHLYPELVQLILTLFSGRPHAVEEAAQKWQALAKAHGLDKNPSLPATQAVNPEQGKGANRSKADALTIGGQDSFWLLEFFKYAGLFQAALPRVVQGRKDRKTYVVMPARDGLEWRWHCDVYTQFQKEFWPSSAIKMDIQAILRFTSAMLQQWEAAQSSSGRRRRPSDYVDGFVIASYKDLGSAVAVMNVATIRLPDWVDWPATQEQASAIRAVVEEHRLLTAVLDEKKSEEEQLLHDYREFLSSRDPNLLAFFNFMFNYAGHSMRRLAKRQPVRRLSTDNLGVIIMANDERRKENGKQPLTPILETPGFLNIATAIRQSTVTQQYYRSKFDDNTYEIRYGLADELRRKSRGNDEFARAISDFIQQYSQENARVRERHRDKGYRKRRMVSTEDIAQLIGLIDTYDASTVASLLVAYGYSYDPTSRDTSNDEPVAENTDVETPDEIETQDH